MKSPTSFKQTLTLYFIAVAVLPLLFLGVVGLQYFEYKHQETTFRLLDAHALNVSHEATEFLYYINASLSSVEKTLNSGLLHNDAEINQYLQIAVSESNSFESIYLLDKDGRITHLGLSGSVASNREDYIGMDLSAHAIFLSKPQHSGQLWSNTFMSIASAETTIALGIPLVNGVLLGTVSLKRLSNELVERLGSVSNNFQFSLLDHHGVLIADSRSGFTEQRLNLRLHPEVRNALDHKVEISYKLHEDNSLLESVRLVPEMGWVAYVSLPMQEAMEGVASLRYLLSSSLFFVACLGGALSVWLSRRMMRPILMLRDAAGEVARGNYGQPLRTAFYKELEDLSGSFREMATAVEEREQVISVNRARLQLLIKHMPFGCILWDQANRVELWNPAAEKIFGFSAAEVTGLHAYEFWADENSLKDAAQIFTRLDKGEFLAHSINDNLTKDGRSIVCEWHNTPLFSYDGTSEGVVSMIQNISRRVSVENSLRESESRFRTVFQTNPDSVMITRLNDGLIIDVNDSCLSAFGYEREEILGKTSLELNLWATLTERDNYQSLVRQHSFVENFEMLLQTKSGRVLNVLTSARILMLNDEACLLAVVRNITALKEAETRLVRSESRFRSLISVMGEGLIILGNNGEIVQCNQAAERILKVKADDLVGKFHDDLILGAVREDGTLFGPEQQPPALTLRTGETVINQIMGAPQIGVETVWLQVNTHALGLDRIGKPIEVVVTFADVTRLKSTENELRESENYLRTLSAQFQGVLEAIPDRIMILDRHMRVVWLNWFEDDISPAGQKLFENVCCYELSEVHCGSSTGNDSFLCVGCPVQEAFKTGRTETLQKELTDGRTLSLRAFPVFNELGQIINVIEISQDITESLCQQTQTMRTGQLAALGELAAGVAHEINNPINGVINYAQLILNKAVADSREAELSQRIIRESERVATIVRELLYFAREESSEIHQTTVLAALNEALVLVKNQLYKEGIALQIQLPDDLPIIASRSHQIQRLFLNLISNARYALTKKYPDPVPDKILQITAEKFHKKQQPFVRVIFRDCGVGIASDLLLRVMNPFVTTKSSAEGTGLGLSICHEIVRKHGGTIAIDSVHGEYTEVLVELPGLTGVSS